MAPGRYLASSSSPMKRLRLSFRCRPQLIVPAGGASLPLSPMEKTVETNSQRRFVMDVGRSPLCCGRLVMGWEHGRVFAVGSCHHPGRLVLPLCQVCDGGKRPRDQEGLPVTPAELAKDSGGADGAGGGAGPGPGAACTTSAPASTVEVVEDDDREWLGAIQPSTKRPARPCTVCGVAASKYAGSGFPPPARQHAITSMP
jgi:hypothetical protein